MDSGHLPLALVVIAGPQASGKSTLARALSEDLRQQGELVALVELDQVAAMALPTLPSWEAAHRIFQTITGMWARSDLTCVIAEGSGSREEARDLLSELPPGAVAVTVATTAPFDVAFARAQADPTRGISKEHTFLSGIYQAWPQEMAGIAPDIVIDTHALALNASIDQIRTAIRSARRRGAGPPRPGLDP